MQFIKTHAPAVVVIVGMGALSPSVAILMYIGYVMAHLLLSDAVKYRIKRHPLVETDTNAIGVARRLARKPFSTGLLDLARTFRNLGV